MQLLIKTLSGVKQSFNFEPTDTILHINDKPALFRKLLKTLKPGGKLMISDYCRGDTSQHTKAFQEYVKQRDYDLHTVTKYGEMLQKCGFKKVRKKINLFRYSRFLHDHIAG